MPDRSLVEPVRTLCLDAAALLTRSVRDGAELSFDLVEERGRGGSLYHYHPRTGEFVESHWPQLRALDSWEPAMRALEPAVAGYARTHLLADANAEAVLRHLLDRLYEDATDFGFPELRFESICSEFAEGADGVVRAVVIARLRGVHLASATVGLDDQLAIAGGHAVHELPPGLIEPVGDRVLPEVVCVFALEQEAIEPLPIAEANARFRRLLTGLRLIGASGARIDSVAWARAGDGPWLATAVDAGAHARREEWRLAESHEEELAELLALLGRTRRAGRLGLALGRFEMGCARGLAGEALIDHLVGLRALLGGRPGGDDARLALRAAALCADGDGRDEVRDAVDHALALEAEVFSGRDPQPGALLDAVTDLEQALRALLRDRLCGYLDEDLAAIADERLVAAGAEGDIDAFDTRELVGVGHSGAEVDDEAELERRAAIASLETQELAAFAPVELERRPEHEAVDLRFEADAIDFEPDPIDVGPSTIGVEPEDEPDDDADCYAGPV